MPHFTVEYSSNLDGRTDIGSLCREILRAALASGVFETGAVRVRAIRCEHFAIADDVPANAFVAINVAMAAGRSAATRKSIGDAAFAAAEAFLKPLFETPHFALSMEIREIDADFNWKNNSMHARLRGK